jgi:hypothetical protein
MNSRVRLYLESVKYIKIGQDLWVDCVFSGTIVNRSYSFHTSSAALAEFWNDSFWATQNTNSRKVTQKQLWHAYVQETIRKVSASTNVPFEILQGASIKEVTKQAYELLGESGIIHSAENHFCLECTHKYKRTADRITGDDPAAVVGVDENCNVPIMRDAANASLTSQDAERVRQNARIAMDVDESDTAPVKMVVMDGIVMGHTHCAWDNCTDDLVNGHCGVFCVRHELLHLKLMLCAQL